MKKKRIPEYEIVETIRKIKNPEKDFIKEKKTLLIQTFGKVKLNGNN